ncbi:MAG: hypothetical protein QOG95_3923 [Mycobacterium sp.]|jgi:hypothetical protein|nr:hypothetical protein [Mycobacterium sp.]
MATVHRPDRTEQLEVEIFEITLNENESKQLLEDPEGFTQELLGPDHEINAVYLSKEIADGANCPDRQLVHVITPGPYNSTHVWECIQRQ